jgi:para-nitrobenzyl esterase
MRFPSQAIRILTLVAGALAAAFVGGAAAAASKATPTGTAIVVATAAGQVQGRTNDGVTSFKGIPYAAAPVGDLRWRAPQPVTPWTDVRLVETYGQDCVQNRFAFDSAPSEQTMSEDCLYLNLWTPAPRKGAGLPVMVWIHGGAFAIGSSSAAMYDGANLARQGVVLVNFNYRLGRFGFFAHPSLVEESSDKAIGNFALMDHIAALKWVKANIAAFGGDPNNVTVFGESSGGGAVRALMVERQAHGLFQRAGIESGGGRDHWTQLNQSVGDRPSALESGRIFARESGLDPDADAASLRALPTRVVLGAVSLLNNSQPNYSGPMVDGRLIVADTDLLFGGGGQARVPLLIGSNNLELGMIPGIGLMTVPTLKTFGADQARLRKLYDPDGGDKQLTLHLLSDVSFSEPARFYADAHAATGTPTWLYRFSYVPTARRADQAGAGHTDEIPYIFDTIAAVKKNASDEDKAAARQISAYWVAFARTGNPNGPGRPAWPAYSRAGDDLLEFTSAGPVVQKHMDKARFDFLAAHASGVNAAKSAQPATKPEAKPADLRQAPPSDIGGGEK